MNKIIPLILFMSVSLQSISQINKNILKSSIFQFSAGIADGSNQAYLFHYSNSGLFEKWNIKPNGEAWRNKWAKDSAGNTIVGKERFWQSSRALVFTTDFHHATRFAESRMNEASLVSYAIGHGAKSKKWYWYVADIAIMFGSRSLGFYIAYEIVFD